MKFGMQLLDKNSDMNIYKSNFLVHTTQKLATVNIRNRDYTIWFRSESESN